MRQRISVRFIAFVLALAVVLTIPCAMAETLSVGSKGDEVIKLQNRLNELGYSVGTVDGDYGNQTKRAVEAFQSDSGLPVTGTADAQTQKLLYATPNAKAAYNLAKKSECEDVNRDNRNVTCQTEYKAGKTFSMQYMLVQINGQFGRMYNSSISLYFQDTQDLDKLEPNFEIQILAFPGEKPNLVQLTIKQETTTLPSSSWWYSYGVLTIDFTDQIDLLQQLLDNGGYFIWSNIYPSSMCGVDFGKSTPEYKALNEVWAVAKASGIASVLKETE